MAKKKKKKTGVIQGLAESAAARLERLQALEQDIQALQQTATEQAETVDPYYTVDPVTGLSPAQIEARAALTEAQNVRTDLGLQGVLTTPAGSAGRIDTPPTEGLKTGYEWYKFNLPGGGYEWRQRPTRDTLLGAYTQIFSGAGGTPVTGGGGGTATTGGSTGGVGGGTAAAAATLAAQQAADAEAEAKRKAGQSAYNLLFEQFNQYGLGSLVETLKGFIVEGLSPAEFTLRLRDTAAYKQRFSANLARIQKGLTALDEATYIGLEDKYQDVMRRYGLPESYYTRGELGRQEGFEKFIANDVSPVELEDRIQTAYNRVFRANAEVGTALRSFYPEITNGDILAYVLDPQRALGDIQRKITAAEIGGAAVQAGLTTNLSDAEYLARYGVTKEQAQQGYRTISGYLPRASQLSEIYAKQGVGPYTQASAEREVFGTPGAAEEERKRQRITSLEQAAFSGASGLTGGALGRERAGQF